MGGLATGLRLAHYPGGAAAAQMPAKLRRFSTNNFFFANKIHFFANFALFRQAGFLFRRVGSLIRHALRSQVSCSPLQSRPSDSTASVGLRNLKLLSLSAQLECNAW